MKLCRFDDDRLGVVRGDQVHDVTTCQEQIRAAHAYASYADAVIAALPDWRERIEQAADGAPAKPLAAVELLSPIARPSKVMGAPTNYHAHIEEMASRRDQLGVTISPKIGTAGIFLKSNSSVVGPSQGIPLRFPERSNEHEAEVVAIIGKTGSDITKPAAMDYIAGYCLGLDMTARGPEDRSFRKSIDGYSVLGPWLVTADEIDDPGNLPFELKVNGVARQQSNTSLLIYDIPRLIEFASSFYTLYPGDVYFTGTPEGVGPVQPGDRITLSSVPALGTLQIEVRAHASGETPR